MQQNESHDKPRAAEEAQLHAQLSIVASAVESLNTKLSAASETPLAPFLAAFLDAARVRHRELMNALAAACHAPPTSTTPTNGAERTSNGGGNDAGGLKSVAPPVIPLTSGPAVYAVTPEHVAASDVTTDSLVDGLLVRKQITLLASIPKGGKSTLTTEVVRDVLDGGLCLDRKTHLHPDENVLWLVEEPCGVFVHRLVREFGFQAEWFGTRLLVAYRREFRGQYKWPNFVAELIAQLAQRGRRIGLVIVDTFAAWTALDGDDEQKSGRVLEAFEPIYQLAEATGAAVLVNHHSRKAGGEDGRAVRGSTAITGGVDTIVELDRPARKTKGLTGLEAATRKRVRTLNALGRLRETCWFERVHFNQWWALYTVLPRDGADSDATPDSDATAAATPGEALSTDERQALTHLASAGDAGMLRAELEKTLGLSKSKVGRLVRSLAKGGYVKTTGRKGQRERVAITDAGRVAIATQEATGAAR